MVALRVLLALLRFLLVLVEVLLADVLDVVLLLAAWTGLDKIANANTLRENNRGNDDMTIPKAYRYGSLVCSKMGKINWVYDDTLQYARQACCTNS